MWDWAVYGALIAGFVAGCGAIALLVARIRDALRTLKRFRRNLAAEMLRLADLGEQTADKLGTATDTAELERSLSHLRVDLARLAILREAVDEVLGPVGRVAWLMPRR